MALPRFIRILFALGGAAILYNLSTQQQQPAATPRRTAAAVAAAAASAAATAAAAASTPPPQQQSPQLHTAAATSSGARFWLPPQPESIPRLTSPVSGCGPAPGKTPNQRAPVLLGRGEESALCASASGEQRTACTIAAAALEGELLLLVGTASQSLESLRLRLTGARAAAGGQLLLVALDAPARDVAQRLGVAWWMIEPPAPLESAAAVEAAHWRAAELLLRAGCSVVRSGGGVLWVASPFAHLSRDVDVEAAQLGGGEARGSVVGVHDPPMGWSAYGQTMTVPWLSAAVVALTATAEAAELAFAMAHAHLASPALPAAELLTQQAIQPAHDAQSRAGVSVRLLRSRCYLGAERGWLGGAVSLLPGGGGGTNGAGAAALRDALVAVHAASAAAARDASRQLADTEALSTPADVPPSGAGRGGDSNDLLRSRTFDEARGLVLSAGCAARPRSNATARPRPLHWLLPKSEPFPRAEGCKEDDNVAALCGVLREVAINREVLAAVSNKNILQMLTTFVEGTRRAKITNTVIVALDEPTAAHVRSLGAASYVRKLVSRTGSTDNHATSGLKFAVLRDFVVAGCSVLLSDVDVLWASNPFTLPSLYRDVDVEGMSDGWDDLSAFGYRWHTAPGRDALRLSARNSGLFFIAATDEVLRMMTRLKRRMETESVWDQTAYNEEMWYVAGPGRDAHGVSARVLNYWCHMNSKSMFRYMVDDEELIDVARHRPVSVHVNYHPEKLPRMQDVFVRYHGVADGVDLGGGKGKDTPRASQGGMLAWHFGVGLKSGKACREAPRMPAGQGLDGSKLGAKLLGKGATWAGIKGMTFSSGGGLRTPWGGGTWGRLRDAPETLFVDFMGQQHTLSEDAARGDAWPTLTSNRCGDSEKVTIKVVE